MTSSFPVEVRYSTGENFWISAGLFDARKTSFASFSLPLQNKEEITNLRVLLISTSTGSATPLEKENKAFHITSVEIHLNSSDAMERENDEVAIPQQGPMFANGFIKSEVYSKNYRSVLLEQGGMLTLWAQKLENSNKNGSWVEIAGDSLLSATSPIGLYEDTIFWIDKNEQALYGYSLSEKSLFGGESNPTKNIYSLLFETQLGVNMRVFYTPSIMEFTYQHEK